MNAALSNRISELEKELEQVKQDRNRKGVIARSEAMKIAEGFKTRAEQAEAKWIQIQNVINPLMCIVEGCLGERWTASSRRLVDTKEWCAFYTAWKRLDRESTKRV